MRIALVNAHAGIVGGVETYLRQLWPALCATGHELAYWCEFKAPSAENQVLPTDTSASCCVAQIGWEKAFSAMQEWRPDVIYAHGWSNPQEEARLFNIAPTVFFAHAYYGACISGNKTFSFPTVRPCQRKFGAGCLGLYIPRRCGGLNPQTAWHDYQRQRARLDLLAHCHRVLVANEYMAQEYRRYGLADKVKIVTLPYPLKEQPKSRSVLPKTPSEKWRLLFLGRMEALKGGESLLEALPLAASQLNRSLHLTLAGDGQARPAWERRAAQLQARHPNLTIDFPGWLAGDSKDAALRSCDVLVMPSLWPEPHGLSGQEAGLYGVPTVAFAVGGIPNWLRDGENGVLANGMPPTLEGLADALVRMLRTPGGYEKMSRLALEYAQRFTLSSHIAQLLPILEGAAANSGSSAHIVGDAPKSMAIQAK